MLTSHKNVLLVPACLLQSICKYYCVHTSSAIEAGASDNCVCHSAAWYNAFLNSLVHVVMYTYYLLATIIGKDAKKKKKYLWWGRYLTQFQMFQFVSMLVQAAYVWTVSPYPKFLSGLLFFYMITLLALFLNFYRKKHGGKTRTTPRKKIN